MNKDRSYYRSESTRSLIEEVHYGVHVDWKELAIALAERLDRDTSAVWEDEDY